ncbi:alpha/beta hydrolase [Streptomyces sp. SID12501]|uniref:Alpha/beta hydrolase n=1 Tax=Streptomyces sp. SID12501 TaxID=2706042 RepID=A0A6B3BYT5_9ACTN|nr:alpha/beta hydrolase [Streptomyces sp. SID12501]NEC89300.1 alpha/beta hydrolase [Streptomyces sp. SID12501]
MSILARPSVASPAARAMQLFGVTAVRLANTRGGEASLLHRFPEFPRTTRELTIPTSIAPAKAVVYLPDTVAGTPVPVHVNFHAGGYVMPMTDIDDSLCRFLAAEAGVAVINVDYVVAPQYRFPSSSHQAFDVVRWVAEHGSEHGWDGSRLTVGGQSAGGGLAAAVARQALEKGGPEIALQVLHYAPLDLATDIRDKSSVIAKPMLRPWMGDMFNSAFVPDPHRRTDPLISPAHPSDTADLTGIAPAYVITAEHDILRAEGARYAERLGKAGALVEHYDVPEADHAYDMKDAAKAREVYTRIAQHVRQAAHPSAAATD